MADRKQTKTVGEHLTCANLARHGWSPALTRDGIERTDILAVGGHLEGRPTVEIQVKTAMGSIKYTSWLLGLKTQMPAQSDREWFVLVAVPPTDKPMRSFVVPRDHVAAAAWVVHMNWLHDPSVAPGKRNTSVAQARVRVEVFADYEDRWDLLGQPATTIPVLLPTWIRSRSLESKIGLPPNHPWHEKLPQW